MKIKPDSHWLLLVASLAAHHATPRMRLWRAVKAGGCAVLRDGAYLLPRRDTCLTLFNELANDVREAGGTAHLLTVPAADAAQEAAFCALFERSAAYLEFTTRVFACHENLPGEDPPALRKTLKNLRRDFDALALIDFFPGEARRQAGAALSELEDAVSACYSPGEPRARPGLISRLDRADYQRRTWATRRNLWVDRMASAWLIRSFIDPYARFIWLELPAACPPEALGFDFDGAVFTHVDSRVTFEVLLASFGLENDRALAKVAALVHFLDVGGIPVSEAAGIETLLGAARSRSPDDGALLTEAAKIFDLLYVAYESNA